MESNRSERCAVNAMSSRPRHTPPIRASADHVQLQTPKLRCDELGVPQPRPQRLAEIILAQLLLDAAAEQHALTLLLDGDVEVVLAQLKQRYSTKHTAKKD